MPALTVATYNAHSWFGTDGRKNPQRILAVLEDLEADMIAPQEVVLPAGGRTCFTLADLKRTTGMAAVPGLTLRRADSDFGNVLLSRRPLRDIRLIDISIRGCEPRGAIAATVDIESLSVTVMATHLGLRGLERRRPIRRLMMEASDLCDRPLILMGDFNEWLLFSPGLALLYARFGR
jgi:endonuclease/exonuclease/phosphatase family metal-dependent hydrolase